MDEVAKRKSLRMISYGTHILTARDGKEVGAGTVNWLSQASFKPPLVMVAVQVDSRLHSIIEKTRVFAINVLGSDQKSLAAEFFKPTKVDGGRVNGTVYEIGVTGSLILLETPASFECTVTDMVKRGDHTVVIGEVVEAYIRRDSDPLFLRTTGWSYGG